MNYCLVPPNFTTVNDAWGTRFVTVLSQSYQSIYRDVLDAVAPHVVWEWGPGKNTDIALEYGAEVLSVEQDARWLHAHHPKLTQVYIDVDHKAYTRTTEDRIGLFFVDSRRRAECIRDAHARHPRAALVLHDCQRGRYWDALSLYRFVIVPDYCATAIATNDWFVMAVLTDVFGDGLERHAEKCP